MPPGLRPSYYSNVAILAESHRLSLGRNESSFTPTYDGHGDRIDAIRGAVILADRRVVQHKPPDIDGELAIRHKRHLARTYFPDLAARIDAADHRLVR